MSDDQLKDFLKRNDVKLERPAGEWERIASRVERKRVTVGSLSFREWFSGVRLALSGGLVAAAIAVVVLAPWKQGDEERAAAMLDDSLNYLNDVGGSLDYFGE